MLFTKNIKIALVRVYMHFYWYDTVQIEIYVKGMINFADENDWDSCSQGWKAVRQGPMFTGAW